MVVHTSHQLSNANIGGAHVLCCNTRSCLLALFNGKSVFHAQIRLFIQTESLGWSRWRTRHSPTHPRKATNPTSQLLTGKTGVVKGGGVGTVTRGRALSWINYSTICLLTESQGRKSQQGRPLLQEKVWRVHSDVEELFCTREVHLWRFSQSKVRRVSTFLSGFSRFCWYREKLGTANLHLLLQHQSCSSFLKCHTIPIMETTTQSLKCPSRKSKCPNCRTHFQLSSRSIIQLWLSVTHQINTRSWSGNKNLAISTLINKKRKNLPDT